MTDKNKGMGARITDIKEESFLKFELNQKVFVKSYRGSYCGKEGTIVGFIWSRNRNHIKIEYQVSIPTPNWHDEQFFGYQTYMGQTNTVLYINESDLSPINSYSSVDTATDSDLDKIAASHGLKRNICEFKEAINDEIRLHKMIPGSVCECGMEKHGFANHSNWCPKHE